MKIDVFNHLDEIKPDSSKSLQLSVVEGLMAGSGSSEKPYIELVKAKVAANNNYRWELSHGIDSIISKSGQFRRRKIKTFAEDGFIGRLNLALKGGARYPILSTVTGVLFGKVNPAMGLLFSAASTTHGMSKTSHDVIARPGDELWKVEEIGKVRSRGGYKMVHIYSLFIVDPFRDLSSFNNIGWLIHEDRKDVHVD